MIEDSWDTASGSESPMKLKHSTLGYPDSDSYPSVSPSPDVDSKTKTFEFALASSPNSTSGNLTAALQTEKEFLDFMFSLPQLQTESLPKEQEPPKPKLIASPLANLEENEVKLCPAVQNKQNPLRILNQNVGNSSRVGLDYLDNLCRMMEQLGELREQNTRLQKRVHYLEELKTLQDMHRGIEGSLTSRKNTLSLGPVSLSYSDLRLDDISDFCLFRQDSEDSLDLLSTDDKPKDDDQLLLELPDSKQRRSSSDEERRPSSVPKDPHHRRASDKEKKSHRSAWGKVKHMISYSKRESVRKKTSSSGHSLSKGHRRHEILSQSSSGKSDHHDPAASVGPDIMPASDPEEYDLDYESYDPDGTSWEWEGEGEGGIWISTKEGIGCESSPFLDAAGIPKKGKPHLTITVPSSEDLSLRNITPDQRHILSEGKISPASSVSSASKLEHKPSPEIPLTPPSQRRPSNWTKVKQAFLTTYPQHLYQRTNHFLQTPGALHDSASSPPPSPSKKSETAFTFEGALLQDESASGSGLSPELIAEDSLKSPSSPPAAIAKLESSPPSGMQKNLADLQRTLTGEFNKKLQEWERLKSNTQGIYTSNGYGGIPTGGTGGDIFRGARPRTNLLDEDLPQEFKKKLHEWEKRKNRDKDKIRMGLVQGHSQHQASSHHHLHLSHAHHGHMNYHDDFKTKKHEEENLPPEFKKKLAEWQIRKAMVGKNQQNVEELQKNLGEEFNRKMAEWEKMKAMGQPKSTTDPEFSERGIASRSSSANLKRADSSEPVERQVRRAGSRGSLPVGARLTNLAETAGVVAGSLYSPTGMVRKGSSSKMKKNKSTKVEKTPLSKTESTQKHRDKELQWLEKELNKIDREKQRLEREKDKFLEREARLEKMRHAMKQAPVEKKEIYIKTSNGEFRFEGISQTFTKKLYEWEERRGIRPESSTFILLDPNYQASVGEGGNQRNTESKLTTSRSECSLTEKAQLTTSAHQSSHSLNEMDKTEPEPLQADNKAASEPTLIADENQDSQKCAVIVHMEDMIEGIEDPDLLAMARRKPSLHEDERTRRVSALLPPYAPEEVSKLIDSSESEENVGRRLSEHKELCRSESLKSEEEYRSLLHENMTLLGKLKEQENLCRALETQMGDIDNKMDTVADQHLKTLEKLHRHVTIMRKSESFGRKSRTSGESQEDGDESESNQRLIEQLKSRIGELEIKGDKLMEDKEQLECAFNLHKEQEADIAESLLMRIRELQEAGAEVNIQTVQCQTDDILVPDESHYASDELKIDKLANQPCVSTKKKRRRRKEDNDKRNDEASDEEKEMTDDSESKSRRKPEKDIKEKKRRRKTPPKKVQKLHNLTADLLFQAKRLEQALVAKHNLASKEEDGATLNKAKEDQLPHARKRSLKGQSSLRLSRDEGGSKQAQRKLHLLGGSARSWASIEAMISNEEHDKPESIWERRAAALASESQDLLAMNAELSRMARELRREMTALWSLRESTSPDSNSSEDTREEVLIKKGILKENSLDTNASEPEKSDKEEDSWLNEEAKSVFESIAALHSDESHAGSPEHRTSPELSPIASFPHLDAEDGTDHETETFEPWRDSHLRFIHSLEKDSSPTGITLTEDPEDELTTWWQVPLPRKRKKQNRITCPSDPSSYNVDKESSPQEKLLSVPPNSSSFKRRSESPKDNLSIEDKVNCKILEINERSLDSPQHHLSLRFLACSSLGSSSASSLASNCAEQVPHDHIVCKDSDESSSTGTMKTNEYSTLRSEILSSSFEYEDTNKDNSSHAISSITNESGRTLSWERKDNFSEKQLRKVNEVIEEASMRLKREEQKQPRSNDRDKKEHNKTGDLDRCSEYRSGGIERDGNKDQNRINFQTEVTLRSIKEKRKDNVLKTRRVSDSQIHYVQSIDHEKLTNNLPDMRFFSLDSTTCKKIVKHPSIRRNQSESDVLHASMAKFYYETDQVGSVFVPTHRTIFTVCRGGSNYDLDADQHKNTQKNFVKEDEKNNRHRNDSFASELENCLNNNNIINSDATILDESESKKTDTELGIIPIEQPTGDASDEHFNSTHEVVDDLHLTKSLSVNGSSSPGIQSTILSFTNNTPAIESMNKVLEAANETSPTVKSMIDSYNKRITENQELLINPFTPGDPFINKKTSLPLQREKIISQFRSKSKVIYKSQSASALSQYISPVNNEHRNFFIGSNVEPESAPIDGSKIPLFFSNQDLGTSLSYSTDNSLGIPNSLEDNQQVMNDVQPSKSYPIAQQRAIRFRKAKEEFLARGAAPLSAKAARNESFRNRSNTIATEGEMKEFESVLANTSLDSAAALVPPAKPPRALDVITINIPRKESFRRQSEGSYPDDRDYSRDVVKSCSSGVLELHKLDKLDKKQSVSSKKPAKSIFRFLKRSRKKDEKDLSTVRKLCRLSLVVDIGADKKRKDASTFVQQCDMSLSIPGSAGVMSEIRGSRTLPREGPNEEEILPTTRSCPSSPVARHKERTVSWLEKGKKIFKSSRSPSPCQKPR